MTIQLHIGGVPEHFNLPWKEIIQHPTLRTVDLELIWTDYPGGTGVMTKELENGNLDIAVLLTEGIVRDIAKGNPSQIIHPFVQSPLKWGIHVAGNQKITHINQIEGKKIAISRYGSGSHLMAYVDASQRGWQVEEKQLVIVHNLEGGLNALKNGDAEVFMWEKSMTMPYTRDGSIMRIGERATPWACFVIAAHQNIIQNYAPQLQVLLEVVREVNQTFAQEPDTLIHPISHLFHLTVSEAQTWLNETQWATDNAVQRKDIMQALGFLEDLHFIPKAIPIEQICHPNFCSLV